jgi:hypothetical protein
MKTKEIIYGAVGLGVLFLGYKAFKKRQEHNLESKPDSLEIPKKSNFDREKSAKELAILFFPLMNRKDIKQPVKRELSNVSGQAVVIDSTGLEMAVPIRKPTTELSLYKTILEGLNLITDDSDAEFVVNVFKKIAQNGGNFKPDLNTEIRVDKINEKYPNAFKKLDLG